MNNSKYFNGLLSVLIMWFFGFKTYYLIFNVYRVCIGTSVGNSLFNAICLYLFGYVSTLQFNIVYALCSLIKDRSYYYNKFKKGVEVIEEFRKDVEKQQNVYKNLEDMPNDVKETYELRKSVLNIYDFLISKYAGIRDGVASNNLVSKTMEVITATKGFFQSESFEIIKIAIDDGLKVTGNFIYNKVSSDKRTKKYIDQLLVFFGYVVTNVDNSKEETYRDFPNFNSEQIPDPAQLKEFMDKIQGAMQTLLDMDDLKKLESIKSGCEIDTVGTNRANKPGSENFLFLPNEISYEKYSGDKKLN